MPTSKIDRFLTGNIELRKRFEELAADPGIGGDRLMRELREAGMPAKRSATFRWMRQYRRFARSRPDSLVSAVVAAVLKLGRGRLIELARELSVRAGDESKGVSRLTRPHPSERGVRREGE